MVLLIVIDTWQWTPFFILILLAGLQSIPEELFESAKIDGASSFQIFSHITFPLLLPISSTVIFVRIIESFKVIDIVRIVTGGGPGNTTESVTLYAYDIGLKGGDIAYASTIAYALLIMVIVFSIIYFVLEKQFKKILGNE
jgi:multiple sugar transport system permease protein